MDKIPAGFVGIYDAIGAKKGSEIGMISQLPIFTMENMIAGIFGSAAGAVLMRPQP